MDIDPVTEEQPSDPSEVEATASVDHPQSAAEREQPAPVEIAEAQHTLEVLSCG